MVFVILALEKIMEKHIFQELPGESESSLKIDAVFQESSMNLTVFENDTAWSTLITKLELKLSADNHKTEYTEYIQNLRKYLEHCPEDVEIKFKEGTLYINILLRNNMKAVYFTTSLRKVKFAGTVFELVRRLYKEKNEHNQILEDRLRQYEILEKSKNNFEAKLNEFIQRKRSEENELFSKFLVILNEKKFHIQHLNELLNAFRRGRPTVNEPVPKKLRKKESIKKIPVKKEASESDSNVSESETSSDEEENKPNISPPKNSTKREISPKPSTSKHAIVDHSVEDEEDNLFIGSKKIKSDEMNRQSLDHESQNDIDENSQDFSSPGIDFDTQDLLNGIP